jgi:hypothetical protein
LIKKKSLETTIDKFLDKFPDYWTPPINYSNALKDLVDFIDGQNKEYSGKLLFPNGYFPVKFTSWKGWNLKF